ncbi:MAG TPA: hypothetical protein VGE40_03955 [Bacilli bacterium]
MEYGNAIKPAYTPLMMTQPAMENTFYPPQYAAVNACHPAMPHATGGTHEVLVLFILLVIILRSFC